MFIISIVKQMSYQMSTRKMFYEQFIHTYARSLWKHRPEVKRQRAHAALKRGGARLGVLRCDCVGGEVEILSTALLSFLLWETFLSLCERFQETDKVESFIYFFFLLVTENSKTIYFFQIDKQEWYNSVLPFVQPQSKRAPGSDWNCHTGDHPDRVLLTHYRWTRFWGQAGVEKCATVHWQDPVD